MIMANWRSTLILLAVYASISVLYTTRNLFNAALQAILAISLPQWTSTRWSSFSADTSKAHFISHDEVAQKASLLQSIYGTQILDNDTIFSLLPQTLLLSKAFSQSLHPTRIYPYFYRAHGRFDDEDITVTTLITRNRLEVFQQLVLTYDGPISVTIHVEDNQQEVQGFLDELHAVYTELPQMSRSVDVHLVIDPFNRQFNTWRNIARLFARTDYVMMLDVDFFICTDFRSAMMRSKTVMQRLREGYSAFVVPAFEYPAAQDQSRPALAFPRDKKSLLEAIGSQEIGMFHASWPAGHNSTEYERFYSAPQGEIYKVTRYQASYEPYVVHKKIGPPWCDERFVGYGGNKAACLYEMYLSGVSFYVLSDHFLIHQGHPYEESARKIERKGNRKLYQDFRMETCLKYIKSYHESKLLDSSTGFNLQQECKKIGGFSRTIYQMIRGV